MAEKESGDRILDNELLGEIAAYRQNSLIDNDWHCRNGRGFRLPGWLFVPGSLEANPDYTFEEVKADLDELAAETVATDGEPLPDHLKGDRRDGRLEYAMGAADIYTRYVTPEERSDDDAAVARKYIIENVPEPFEFDPDELEVYLQVGNYL